MHRLKNGASPSSLMDGKMVCSEELRDASHGSSDDMGSVTTVHQLIVHLPSTPPSSDGPMTSGPSVTCPSLLVETPAQRVPSRAAPGAQSLRILAQQ